ncbi:hypothetical protein [Amycolatopsis sp. cmx-11-12]|uniref:hypothetical protein n=1 Tax=Amycolatopsis sp. cmx-11-12 TaxID=2785795 RepID=UPI0039183EF5
MDTASSPDGRINTVSFAWLGKYAVFSMTSSCTVASVEREPTSVEDADSRRPDRHTEELAVPNAMDFDTVLTVDLQSSSPRLAAFGGP